MLNTIITITESITGKLIFSFNKSSREEHSVGKMGANLIDDREKWHV